MVGDDGMVWIDLIESEFNVRLIGYNDLRLKAGTSA